MIHDSSVVADGEESPGKEKKSRDDSRLSRLDSPRHRLHEQYCFCELRHTIRARTILRLPGLLGGSKRADGWWFTNISKSGPWSSARLRPDRPCLRTQWKSDPY